MACESTQFESTSVQSEPCYVVSELNHVEPHLVEMLAGGCMNLSFEHRRDISLEFLRQKMPHTTAIHLKFPNFKPKQMFFNIHPELNNHSLMGVQ